MASGAHKDLADFWWVKAAPARCVRTLDGAEIRLPDSMALSEFDSLCRRVLELPEGPHLELLHGRPVVHPRPHDVLHSSLRSALWFAIADRFEAIEQAPRFGIWGFDLRSERLQSYLTADLMVVPRELCDDTFSFLPNGGIPPLVIEVVSDTSAALDLGERRDIYQDYGVPEYWVCDPSTCAIMLHRLKDGSYERVLAEGDGSLWSDFLRSRVRVYRAGLRYTVHLERR